MQLQRYNVVVNGFVYSVGNKEAWHWLYLCWMVNASYSQQVELGQRSQFNISIVIDVVNDSYERILFRFHLPHLLIYFIRLTNGETKSQSESTDDSMFSSVFIWKFSWSLTNELWFLILSYVATMQFIRGCKLVFIYILMIGHSGHFNCSTWKQWTVARRVYCIKFARPVGKLWLAHKRDYVASKGNLNFDLNDAILADRSRLVCRGRRYHQSFTKTLYLLAGNVSEAVRRYSKITQSINVLFEIGFARYR